MEQTKWIEISHSLGAPFGGIGTGYFAYGRHGFTHINMNGYPEAAEATTYPRYEGWGYDTDHPQEGTFALGMKVNGEKRTLQTRTPSWEEAVPCTEFRQFAYMPLVQSQLAFPDIRVELMMYSSLQPHDLQNSSIPACVIDAEMENISQNPLSVEMGFSFAPEYAKQEAEQSRPGIRVFRFEQGESAFTEPEAVTVAPGKKIRQRMVIAWYFPEFDSAVRKRDTIYQYDRLYTRKFENAEQVVDHAMEHADQWKQNAEKWHHDYEVPPAFSRLWFASVSSLITSTMLSREGYFFEIEQPHDNINTMDVCAYSCWIYMINWPELEDADMNQFLSTIPRSGENIGLVYHHLWHGIGLYAEESTFVTRIWRWILWSRDAALAGKSVDAVRLALECAYHRDHEGHLLHTVKGTQSYDTWPMPGISSYINSAWIFALYSYKRIAEIAGVKAVIVGEPVEEFLEKALQEYDQVLWNPETNCWRLFQLTDRAQQALYGDSVFSDQLFGLWMVAIDADCRQLLSREKCSKALHTILENNLLQDEQGFCGWANGVTFGRTHVPESIHAATCWLSTQLNLGSLLGLTGDEEACIRVFEAVESSMGRNILAGGEYNKSADDQLHPVTEPREPGKDTPRFPPYPRYKSSWEYVARLLGLTMNWDELFFQPTHQISFRLHDVWLAGLHADIQVEEGWTHVQMDGKEQPLPLRIPRCVKQATLKFIR